MTYLICISMQGFSQQVLVNREWDHHLPGTLFYEKSVVKTDASNNVYNLGSTLTATGHDWILTKVDRKGQLLWTAQFDGDAGAGDLALDLYIDNANGVVYVSGGSTQYLADSMDACIVQFDKNTGIKNWHRYLSGTHPGRDFFISIAPGNAGDIFLGGVTTTDTSGYDYLLCRFSSSGTELYSRGYDYAHEDDKAVKTVFNPAVDRILLSGTSKGPAAAWDFYLREYNASSGALVAEYRTPAGIGDHTPVDIKYQDGLYYLTGYVNNPLTGYDIKTMVLDTAMQVIWEHTFDGPSGLEDRAASLAVDASGNVFVTGYTRHPSQQKNLVVLKYNSVGNLVWAHTLNGLQNMDDGGTDIETMNGKIYIGGYYNGNRTGVSCYDTSGTLYWQKISDVLISSYADLAVDAYQQVILSCPVNNALASEKYVELAVPSDAVVDTGGVPLYKAHELIVGFNPEKVNHGFVNATGKEYAQVEDVIDSALVVEMGKKLDVDLFKDDEALLIKIFHDLNTGQTISISRSGYEVAVPPFWASFSFRLPSWMNEITAMDSLKTLADIASAELNVAFELMGTNDPVYNSGTDQSSLHYTATYPNAHINVDSVWENYEIGTAVKVGILDNGILYTHEDFGYAGPVSPGDLGGTKIIAGTNYDQPSVPITDLTTNASSHFYHGTPVAGIIGALRNNGTGIAGISGGDQDSLKRGAELVDMRVCCEAASPNSMGYISALASALVDGAISGSAPHGLDIMNMSLASSFPSNDYIILPKALAFARQNEVVLVAARGGIGTSGGAEDTAAFYPACHDPALLISVGASGTDGYALKQLYDNGNGGAYLYTSNGRGMDFLAPGATANIFSTDDGGISNYGNFGGTSAAAAHVTGVACLMLSDFLGKSSYPNNLNMEDIEHVLGYTAYNYHLDTSHVYTSEEGWGKINAKKALDMLQKPYYGILHFTVWANQSNMTLEQSHFNPTPAVTSWNIFANPMAPPYPANGIYSDRIDLYKISGTIDQTSFISPSTQVLGYWVRNSYSDAWGHYYFTSSPSYLKTNGWADVKFETFSPASAKVSGYIYYRHDYDMWIPYDPAEKYVRLSYSVHVYDSLGEIGIHEIEDEITMNLYPNPATEQVNISVSLLQDEELSIEVTDISGKLIYKLPSNPYPAGINMISIPLTGLADGVYIVNLQGKHHTDSRKFIKQ